MLHIWKNVHKNRNTYYFRNHFNPVWFPFKARPKNELYLGRSEIEKWNHAGHDLQTSNVRRKFEIWRDIQKKYTDFISRNIVSKIINNVIDSKRRNKYLQNWKMGAYNGLPQGKSLLEVKIFYVLEAAIVLRFWRVKQLFFWAKGPK